MSDFRQSHRLVRLWTLRAVTVVLLFVIFVLARGVWDVYKKERETRHDRARVETQLASLMNREAALREEIAYMQTDRGIEAELRKQYEVGHEGEQLLLIVDRVGSGEPEVSQPESWWKRLWPF